MNDTDKLPQVQDQSPPPEESQVLSPKRRFALVTYLAILFALAFLFVAVTMAIETRRLKNMNEELKDSSQKTSASLTGNINALQEENRQLSKSNEELTAQIAALEAALEAAEAEAETQTAQAEQLTAELRRLEAEKAELELQVELLDKQAADAILVSELLQRAVVLNEEGALSELSEVLEQIAPLRDLLSLSEKDIYESLLID